MTQFTGAVVGAAVAGLTFAGLNPALKNGTVARIVADYVELAASLAQDDTVLLATVDWDTIFDRHSVIDFDDFGTSVTLDVGVAGATTCLVDSQDIAAAAGSVALLKSVAIENRHKPLWQLAGYASRAAALLVAARADVIASFKDANPDAGTLAWALYGSRQ